jgi:hypothetical protein
MRGRTTTDGMRGRTSALSVHFTQLMQKMRVGTSPMSNIWQNKNKVNKNKNNSCWGMQQINWQSEDCRAHHIKHASVKSKQSSCSQPTLRSLAWHKPTSPAASSPVLAYRNNPFKGFAIFTWLSLCIPTDTHMRKMYLQMYLPLHQHTQRE